MKKSLQVRNIKKALGSKADLIDVESLVDSRLSYSENKRIVLKKAKSRGVSKSSTNSFKGSSLFYEDKARKLNSLRSKRSLSLDGTRTAKRTFKSKLLTKQQFNTWKKNKNRYDIDTVDGYGTYNKPVRQKRLTRRQVEYIEDDIL